MKLARRICVVLISGLLLLFLLLLGWLGPFHSPAPAQLSLTLLAVHPDPMHRHPERSTVLNGISTLAAIFAVSNSSPDAAVWFDTAAVEQKADGKWRRFPVPNYNSRALQRGRGDLRSWIGISSEEVNNSYPPGTCWSYVVAWPGDVPTNATWRLALRYGRQASTNAIRLDDALGIRFFSKPGKGKIIYTPEVTL